MTDQRSDPGDVPALITRLEQEAAHDEVEGGFSSGLLREAIIALTRLHDEKEPCDRSTDRAFIEQMFRDGGRARERDEPPTDHPYGKGSLAEHWWTRGYAYVARLMNWHDANARADAAEQALHQAQELSAVVRAFLVKWPEVEKQVNGIIGLQTVRMGTQAYRGPNVGAEIADMQRLCPHEAPIASSGGEQ